MEQEFAKYKITGLVDKFDEQGNITGQFPIGSVQELPVEYGTKMVDQGYAELVVDEEEVGGGETGEAEDEDEEVEGSTGETGEDEIE